MANDDEFIEDLVKTVEDGRDGYAKAAEQLEGDGHGELAGTFRRYSEQRDQFETQIRGVENKYGEDHASGGSVAATLHRGWIVLKDAVTGSSPSAVLKAAIQGEDQAIERYESALSEDLSAELKDLVALQLEEIKLARAALVELEKAHA